eukprot:m.102568 g.102568  ORF g.102568 m.102568 type:complete len:506 (+) comp37178_c0_seq5:31-1548(+)
MSTTKASFVSIWIALSVSCGVSSAKYVEGILTSEESYCCQKVLMYDTQNQWDDVYKSTLNCTQREKVLDRVEERKISLLPSAGNDAGCTVTNSDVVLCNTSHELTLSRTKWAYFAISNCQTTKVQKIPLIKSTNSCFFCLKGLSLNYQLHMRNPGGFWTAEFSADEQGILQTNIAFLIAFFVMFTWAFIRAGELHEKGMFHTTFKIFLWAVFLQIFSLLLLCIHYGVYANDGIGVIVLKSVGRLFSVISEIIFLLMLLLFAKGWTVVRGRLSISSQVKLSMLLTMYTFAYSAMFVWEAVAFDPGKVLYLYDSPAGYGVVGLSFIAFTWFFFAVITTCKKNPDKMYFYLPFCVVYSTWFLARPVIVLISNNYVEDWVREKVVNGVNIAVAYLAYLSFLLFTIPSSTNFPFHLKTTQVDVALSEDEGDEHVYAPSPQYLGSLSPKSYTLFQGADSRDSIRNDVTLKSSAPASVDSSPELNIRSTHVPYGLFSAQNSSNISLFEDSKL